MPAKITFFPVGNGDMTLITLGNPDDSTGIGTNILIDCCISKKSDYPCDVLEELTSRLNRDSDGRLYVDAFCLSHPDEDHCRGLSENFYLGDPEDYQDEDGNNILIREMWSSPVVFRRASKKWTLCDDAKEWRQEAKRRVDLVRQGGYPDTSHGNSIKLIGKDFDKEGEDKNADLESITYLRRDEITNICGEELSEFFEMQILAPFDEEDINSESDDDLSSNESSIIARYVIPSEAGSDFRAGFLTGGDAEVLIWEKVDDEYDDEDLEYDILQCPHHCSWHSLSYDSWSRTKNPELNEPAKRALGHALQSAIIISSSKSIKDDKKDPPCWGAKLEYLDIKDGVGGDFLCTGESPSKESPEPIEIYITSDGHQIEEGTGKSGLSGGGAVLSGTVDHGG